MIPQDLDCIQHQLHQRKWQRITKEKKFREGGGAATLFQIKYYKELVHKSLMLLSTETKIK